MAAAVSKTSRKMIVFISSLCLILSFLCFFVAKKILRQSYSQD